MPLTGDEAIAAVRLGLSRVPGNEAGHHKICCAQCKTMVAQCRCIRCGTPTTYIAKCNDCHHSGLPVEYYDEPDGQGNVGCAKCNHCGAWSPFRDDASDPIRCECGGQFIIDEDNMATHKWPPESVTANLLMAQRLVRLANGLLSGEGMGDDDGVPVNFYRGTSSAIATWLHKNSANYQQAIKRITAYLNRAGKNLSAADRQRLEAAKEKLRKLYARTAGVDDLASSLGVKLDILKGRHYWSLSRIVVPAAARDQGAGSQVMKALCAEADAAGATVALTPSVDFGATSVARLTRFYKQFGFVENRGRNKDFTISESMYRLPVGR